MSKLLPSLYILFILFLSSCSLLCDEACVYEKKLKADVETKVLQEKMITQELEKRKQIEIASAIELAKTPEQRQEELRLKLENEKLEIQRKNLEANESQANSLEYLEDSRQVHDTIEVIGVGYSIFKALNE